MPAVPLGVGLDQVDVQLGRGERHADAEREVRHVGVELDEQKSVPHVILERHHRRRDGGDRLLPRDPLRHIAERLRGRRHRDGGVVIEAGVGPDAASAPRYAAPPRNKR